MPNSRRPDGSAPERNGTKKKRSRRWIGYVLLILVGMMLGVGGLAGTYVYQAYQDLPVFEEFDPSLTSMIYDRTGKKIYELADEENRSLVKLTQIPEEVQWAFVATEDHRFREHFGIDVYRLGGAIIADIKYVLGIKGSQWEGASTITMQLARNAFLTLDVTPKRKIQEMLIAIDLEKRYTKDQILEQYLNTVAFGGQAYGIEAAAQQYFSKHASELTLSEGAMMAGILKGPSLYSPFENYEGAMERREIVLDLMVQHGYLDPARAKAVKAEKVVVKRSQVTPSSVTFNGDWYVDHVLTLLTNPEEGAKYKLPSFTADDLYHKGLKVYTALDPNYQKIAQETLATMMPKATEQWGGSKNVEVPQGAVVIQDHRNGEVLALVGGLKHERMLGLNRATQSRRDPGSTIKPLVAYLPAIDLLGWGPATVIDDSPPRLNEKGDNVWPENYEFRYSGLKPLRYGLEQSINAMAVRALEAVTPGKAIQYGKKLGLPLLTYEDGPANDEHLALALGGLTNGATPMEMTAAYGVLGSLGAKSQPIVITKIENKYGEVIWQSQQKKEQVINRDSTWLMVDIMKGSIQRGTAYHFSQGWHKWPAAGKTGTTEEWHDAWFIGFTPEIVTGVWTGYDNLEGRKPLPSSSYGKWTGAGPPTQIWTAIMDQIYKSPPPDWERPNNVVAVDVCETSGMLPSPLCPPDKIKRDWFRSAFVPKQMDNVLTNVTVVRQPWINPKDKSVVQRYYLWKPGCTGTPETLTLIKRPTVWVKHPKDPNNIGKYWPADWWTEVPTETCSSQPAGTKPGTGTGTQPPGTGTQPPATGTQPPATGTKPPSTGTQPPSTGGLVTPPVLPPPILPPGTTKP